MEELKKCPVCGYQAHWVEQKFYKNEMDNAIAKIEEEHTRADAHWEKLHEEGKDDEAQVQQAYCFGLQFALDSFKK